jgi:hypothetical protein
LSSIKLLEIDQFEPYEYPENFDDFLLELVQNSQNTLYELSTSYNFFPSFELSKIHTFRINTTGVRLKELDRLLFQVTQTIHIANEMFGQVFEMLIEKAVEFFPELSVIILDQDDIQLRYEDHTEGKTDPIIKTMIEKYSKNLSTSNVQPGWGGFMVPPKIASFKNQPTDFTILSDLQYLFFNWSTEDLQNPLETWKDFENFIQACPKLEIIVFGTFTKKDCCDFDFPNLSEESKQIWKQRLSFLKSRDLTLYFEEDSETFFEDEYDRLWKQHDITFEFQYD